MSLPNPSMNFTPLDTLPASDLNKMVENIEALSDGSGLADGAVKSNNIDFTTLLYGKHIKLQKTTTQAIPATTQTKIQFNDVVAGYDTDLFAVDSYGVKILSPNIKSVTVTLLSQRTTSTVCILYIYINSTQKTALSFPSIDSGALPSITLDVAQNDIIYGYIWSAGSATVSSSPDWNNMTVVVSELQ